MLRRRPGETPNRFFDAVCGGREPTKIPGAAQPEDRHAPGHGIAMPEVIGGRPFRSQKPQGVHLAEETQEGVPSGFAAARNRRAGVQREHGSETPGGAIELGSASHRHFLEGRIEGLDEPVGELVLENQKSQRTKCSFHLHTT